MALDALLAFQLDLHRFDAGVQADVLGLLKNLEKDLVAKLSAAGKMTEWNRTKINKLLAETRDTIARYYGEAQGTLFGANRELAPIAASNTAAAMETMIPIGTAASLPTDAHLAAIAGDAITQGATMKAWWEKQAGDTAFRFSAAVRQGLLMSETNAQIIQRITGKAGFPGVMEISRANAAALVQTSVAQVANDARMAVFEKNEDLIAKYRWVTALDSHVCPRCAALADKTWKPGESMPHPPIHFNDRCVLNPEMKTWKELGVAAPEPPPGMRASRNGPVPADTTFAQFLERQSEKFQNETLGPGRAQMWRDGKISLGDLTNGRGNPLTLEQLKAKYGS